MVFLERAEFALLFECAGADAKDLIAFLVGTGLAFIAMSAKQEPESDEPAEGEAAH